MMTVLGAIFMLSTALVFGSVAIFSGSIADRLRSEKFQLYLNRTSAVIFLGLAVMTVLTN